MMKPLLLALICLPFVICQDPCDADPAQVSCDACISASHLCKWCPYFPNDTALKMEPPAKRCRSSEASVPACPPEYEEQNPIPSIIDIIEEPLSESSSANTIQVIPQNITLGLRRGSSSSFNMTFRSLRNTPLDVYFLMDLSSSLNPFLQALSRNLGLVAETLVNISTNFKMGFGSFVDKGALPYALSSYMRRIANSTRTVCNGFSSCVPTYSFRNYQPLSSNVSEVNNSINTFALLSGNVDAPEGGLEALLQVAVCTNLTGWRPNALRMAFMITDQGYHSAGDGRLAAIIKPNDGECHMKPIEGETHRFEYTDGLVQDYPSLYQIRQALLANLIVPVFALAVFNLKDLKLQNNLNPTYSRLVDELRGTQAQFINFVSFDPSEITRIIDESYERTIQRVRVNDQIIPGYTIEVTPVQGCKMTEDGCLLQFNEEVTFEVTVTLDDCETAGPDKKRVMLVGPPFSFSTVDLVPLCDCNCSREEPETNSSYCTDRGSLSCGLCECGDLFFGKMCQCNETVTDCPSATLRNNVTLICSGQGECTSCGLCKCNPGVFGEICQHKSNCSECNPENGRCVCEDEACIGTKCVCNVEPISNFTYFQSTINNTGNCMCNPLNCYNSNYPNELCHNVVTNEDGRDYCRCANCVCPSGFTDSNNTCIRVPCSENQMCAICRLTNFEDSNCEPCKILRYIQGSPPLRGYSPCSYPMDNCNNTFYFRSSMDPIYFTSVCLVNNAPYIIAGSLVGAILLLGCLLLLLLKLCLMFWDRHEYKKFTKELVEAEFAPHENPLYCTPQQEYPNPLLRRKKTTSES